MTSRNLARDLLGDLRSRDTTPSHVLQSDGITCSVGSSHLILSHNLINRETRIWSGNIDETNQEPACHVIYNAGHVTQKLNHVTCYIPLITANGVKRQDPDLSHHDHRRGNEGKHVVGYLKYSHEYYI